MPSAARCLGSAVGRAWLQGCPRLARDLSGFHAHITHRCSGDGFRFLYTGLALSHRAASLVSGAVHRFRLRAENGVGHSVWSPVLEVGTAATTPGEPEGLARLGATLTSVSLVWKVRECVGDGTECRIGDGCHILLPGGATLRRTAGGAAGPARRTTLPRGCMFCPTTAHACLPTAPAGPCVGRRLPGFGILGRTEARLQGGRPHQARLLCAGD